MLIVTICVLIDWLFPLSIDLVPVLRGHGWPDSKIEHIFDAFEKLFPGFGDFHFSMIGWTKIDIESIVEVLGSIEAQGEAMFATQKFMEYLKKYKPDGWTHYDVEDLSEVFEKLFE